MRASVCLWDLARIIAASRVFEETGASRVRLGPSDPVGSLVPVQSQYPHAHNMRREHEIWPRFWLTANGPRLLDRIQTARQSDSQTTSPEMPLAGISHMDNRSPIQDLGDPCPKAISIQCLVFYDDCWWACSRCTHAINGVCPLNALKNISLLRF